jgi:hypothetical protein
LWAFGYVIDMVVTVRAVTSGDGFSVGSAFSALFGSGFTSFTFIATFSTISATGFVGTGWATATVINNSVSSADGTFGGLVDTFGTGPVTSSTRLVGELVLAAWAVTEWGSGSGRNTGNTIICSFIAGKTLIVTKSAGSININFSRYAIAKWGIFSVRVARITVVGSGGTGQTFCVTAETVNAVCQVIIETIWAAAGGGADSVAGTDSAVLGV